MSVRIQAFGMPRVHLDGSELSGFAKKPRRCALLVFLAVEGTSSRDRISAIFWPDSSAKRGRAALSQTLLELKRDLGDRWLEREGDSLRLTDSVTTDVAAFREAVETGRHAEALEISQGEFMMGSWVSTAAFEAWLDTQRAGLGRDRKRCHKSLVASRLANDDLHEAVSAAHAWVAEDPLDDEAQHTLIDLMARSGNRSAALVQYVRYRDLIEAELGVEPLEQTIALVEDIRTPESASRQKELPEVAPDGLRRSVGLAAPLDDDLQILRPLGRGSMADVHLAREPTLRRLVAVKVLRPELATNEVARARFKREAQSAARILHPNVATVHRVGTLPTGEPFLVMPFIEGRSLADRLESEGPLAAAEVRSILPKVASALAAAHAHGVVHRDVRPGNVLVEESTGQVYLCDFGLAGVLASGDAEIQRITKTNEMLGFPEYTSPELMEGAPLTAQSDTYGLGMTGLTLLLGKPPQGEPESDLFDSALERCEELDLGLGRLLRRCVAKNPRHRPAAGRLARQLDELSHATPSLDPGWLGQLLEARIPRILLAYSAAAWILLQVVGLQVDMEVLPIVAYHLALTTTAAGLPFTMVLAWFHGRPGRQPVRPKEVWLLSAIGVVWIATSLTVVVSSLG